MNFEDSVPRNVKDVQRRIGEAALRAGRKPDDVQLVAVTKTFPAEAVAVAWACGLRHFGENRPREAVGKLRRVAELLGDETPTWHMIGHIQSRKARWVVEFYDWVHAIDRLSIAEKLSRKAVNAGRELPVLLECNVSGEESKYGFDVAGWADDDELREHFFAVVAPILTLPGLNVRGLMTMAPYVDDAETVRPIFASLRRLRGALRGRFPETPWKELSMGMTNDFEAAVEEGATLVRVGRGIFGERSY